MAGLIASGPTLSADPTWAQEANGAQLLSVEHRISEGNAAVISLYEEGRYEEALTQAKSVHAYASEKVGAEHLSTLISLRNLAFLYRSQGRYGEAEPLHLQALELSRTILGSEHPDTLRSLNNLAALYVSQGRYTMAEPLFLQTLERRRSVLGPEHPDTLSSLSNLAVLYENQKRYGEAEPLFLQALELSRKVLGAEHQQTLSSLKNLAFLNRSLGRYGEAERLFLEALELSWIVHGAEHPKTLSTLNTLAVLRHDLGRYGEAEPLFLQALKLRRKVIGAEHPDALISLNNLAVLYERQGRVGESETLFLEALELSRKVLGAEHPQTLSTLNSLALLYHDLGRDDAEPLLLQALELRRKVLGAEHPDTLKSLNSLAFLYESQDRVAESKALFFEALELSRSALGAMHPNTLSTEFNLVALLVRSGDADMAALRLERINEHMARWSKVQPTTPRQASNKSLLPNHQSRFHDVAIHLAALHPSDRTRRLAADTMLRWKHLALEEEAYLAQLIRTAADGRVRKLCKDILSLRSALAEAHNKDRFKDAEAMLAKLEEQEASLSKVSADFRQYRRIRSAGSRDVETALPEGSVLLEFRRYQPYDYAKREFGWPRWAAVLLRPNEKPLFADLRWIVQAPMLNRLMGDAKTEAGREKAATRLYETLFRTFEDVLAEAKTVYVSPDGVLNLIPFERLRLPDGRYWMERQTIRIVHSGQVLIEARQLSPNKGLLAIGGVDFDNAETAALTSPAPGDVVQPETVAAIDWAIETARGRFSRNPFTTLNNSGPEVDDIAAIYKEWRSEPITLWKSSEAREAQIKTLSKPPRVAHFATHGFYLPMKEQAGHPMLLSALTLAGANNGLEGTLDADGEDGVLFAIEASGLNLHQTELTVMSACNTAQGGLDYSEGVYGLAQAFRIAGSQNTLMTLWALNDQRARDFMEEFYFAWLKEPDRDPAEALREVKLDWARSTNVRRSDPRVWAPYVIVQNGR